MSHALAEWDEDSTLYLFTSLTAGSSHIVTATSRIETILRANRLHFTYIDTATNESARKLFSRRGRGKKLPLLVKQGEIIGDLAEIEELNEFGELKDAVGTLPPPGDRSIISTPAKMAGPYSTPSSNTASPAGAASESTAKGAATSLSSAAKEEAASSPPLKENKPTQQSLQQALASEAAAKVAERKKKKSEATKAQPVAEISCNEAEVSAAEGNAAGEIMANEGAVESSSSIPLSVRSSDSPSRILSAQSSTSTHDTSMREHRGSSLSLASDEAIKEIEQAMAIPEAPEEEEEDLETPAQETKELPKPTSSSVEEIPEEVEPPLEDAKTASDKDPHNLRASLSKVTEARSDENVTKRQSTAGSAEELSTSTASLTEASLPLKAKHAEMAAAEASPDPTAVENALPASASGKDYEVELPHRDAQLKAPLESPSQESISTTEADQNKSTFKAAEVSTGEPPKEAASNDVEEPGPRKQLPAAIDDTNNAPSEPAESTKPKEPQKEAAGAGEDAGESVGD